MKKCDIEKKIYEINGDLREVKGRVSTLSKLQLAELSMLVVLMGMMLAL